MCVSALASESLDALGCQVSLLLDPILDELEGGNTFGLFPQWLSETSSPRPAVEVAAATAAPMLQNENTQQRGGARMRVRYDVHLPALSLLDRENSRLILVVTVLLTLRGALLCKNWHLCGVYWEGCDRKILHVPTPP